MAFTSAQQKATDEIREAAKQILAKHGFEVTRNNVSYNNTELNFTIKSLCKTNLKSATDSISVGFANPGTKAVVLWSDGYYYEVLVVSRGRSYYGVKFTDYPEDIVWKVPFRRLLKELPKGEKITRD